jgi:predicted alpha/beta-hydrolase family hydrolase
MRNAIVAVVVAAAALAALTAFGKDAAESAEADIPTARGVALKAVVHRPATANGAAVVLAPGQGYDKEKPLMKRGAEALAEAGFVAIRFDWAYWTAKGQPADGYATEIADVDAVVAFAAQQTGVTKVLLAGKSLGSVVALAWSNAHESSLAGLALLTFPNTKDANPTADDLAKSGMAPLIVSGDVDPLLDRTALYATAAKMSHAPLVVIVPGDHGFGNGTKGSPDAAENVDLAVKNLVVWAKRRIAAK